MPTHSISRNSLSAPIIKRIHVYTMAIHEVVIEIEGNSNEDIMKCVSGYLDNELVQGDEQDDYFYVNENNNFVDCVTKQDVTDDQREGLVALLCTEFGYLLENGIKFPLDRVNIIYPKNTDRRLINEIDFRLKLNSYGFNNWKIPL